MSNKRNYVIIYLCAAIGPLAGNAITVMLQPLKESLDANIIDISLSIPAFMIPFAFLQLFSGALSDKWGRKNVMISGLAIYGLSSLAIIFVTSLAPFLLLRIAQGVGNAFIAPVAIAMLADFTERSRYGVVMGFYGSFTTAGIFLGPLLGGFLTDIDWRLAFVLFTVLAVAGLLLVMLFLSYPSINERRQGGSIMKNYREAAKHRKLVNASVIGALTFFSSAGAYFFLADHLGVALAFTPSDIGLITSMSGLVGIFMSPLAGRLIDRCSPRLSAILGLVIVIPAMLSNLYADQLYQFIALSMIIGVGTSLLWTALLSAAVGEIPHLRGTSSSMYNASRFGGFALSTLILGPIYEGYTIVAVFITAGVLLATCLLLAVRMPGKLCK